ncbi:MAG: hypothetical protein K9L70_14955 [Thiohalocapsa sp.]|jgi:hypothetical protein|nr:hypothetical protein [Thiohalocapsa sp.]MCF7991474.1 hypothetical protein [Thiohalocapsa sp.]
MTEETPDERAHRRAKAGFEMVSAKDVAAREDMDTEHKIALLQQWEQDLREQMVAEEENMTGADAALSETLSDVLSALEQLGAERTPTPTKHG